SSRYPRALWEISSAPAQRSEFHSPPSSACELRSSEWRAGRGARLSTSKVLLGIGFSRNRHPRDPLQIVSDLNLVPTQKQTPHSIGNRPADFKHQPSPRSERRERLRNHPPDHFHPRRPGKHRIPRLELAHFELHRIFFRLAHVGRIRNHKVE